MGVDELDRLGVQHPGDALHHQPLRKLLHVVDRPPLPDGDRRSHEPLDVGSSHPHVGHGEQRASELARPDLSCAQPGAVELVAGVAADQRAVEVEERADLRTLWAGLDLGDPLAQITHARACAARWAHPRITSTRRTTS